MHSSQHPPLASLPARDRAQLTATGVTVNRGGRRVLTDAAVRCGLGTRLAVVGENGRGKSTLLHVLAGRLAPDAGHVHLVGTLGLAEQELDAPAERTVGHLLDDALRLAHDALASLDEAADRLADGSESAAAAYAAALGHAEQLDAWGADRRLEVALEALGACTDRARPLRTLSVGQRYRVRLACLLGADDDFLLLDEPTNHLDAAGLDFLTRALRAHRGGVVLVSHDRALLQDVATDLLDLDPTRDGRPRTYGGGYAGLVEGRRRERERWQADYDAQQAEHARLARAADQARARLSTGWRPDKGTGRHQRQSHAPSVVQAARRQQEALAAHRLDVPPPPPGLAFPDLPARPGVTLLGADEVTVAGRLTTPVSLHLESGDRLVLTGPNGAGKSTLLRLLAGDLEPTGGTVHRARHARVALLTQESDHPGAQLSTGQLRRRDLERLLATRPEVLLLDEPTNHLAATLVDALTEALRATPAAVVIATHDRQLLRDTSAWPHLPLA